MARLEGVLASHGGAKGRRRQWLRRYPEGMQEARDDAQFARESGERILLAFTLCTFASQLVGKATE